MEKTNTYQSLNYILLVAFGQFCKNHGPIFTLNMNQSSAFILLKTSATIFVFLSQLDFIATAF